MERSALIGGGIVAAAFAGVVGFYVLMSGGNTGDIPEHTRRSHQVEQVVAGKQVGAPKVVPTIKKPEDPAQLAFDGTKDKTEKTNLGADAWAEARAMRAASDNRQITSMLEEYLSKHKDVNRTAVMELVEARLVKQAALNAEIEEGLLMPHEARKQNKEEKAALDEKMREHLGEAGAEEFKNILAARRLRLY